MESLTLEDIDELAKTGELSETQLQKLREENGLVGGVEEPGILDRAKGEASRLGKFAGDAAEAAPDYIARIPKRTGEAASSLSTRLGATPGGKIEKLARGLGEGYGSMYPTTAAFATEASTPEGRKRLASMGPIALSEKGGESVGNIVGWPKTGKFVGRLAGETAAMEALPVSAAMKALKLTKFAKPGTAAVMKFLQREAPLMGAALKTTGKAVAGGSKMAGLSAALAGEKAVEDKGTVETSDVAMPAALGGLLGAGGSLLSTGGEAFLKQRLAPETIARLKAMPKKLFDKTTGGKSFVANVKNIEDSHYPGLAEEIGQRLTDAGESAISTAGTAFRDSLKGQKVKADVVTKAVEPFFDALGLSPNIRIESGNVVVDLVRKEGNAGAAALGLEAPQVDALRGSVQQLTEAVLGGKLQKIKAAASALEKKSTPVSNFIGNIAEGKKTVKGVSPASAELVEAARKKLVGITSGRNKDGESISTALDNTLPQGSRDLRAKMSAVLEAINNSKKYGGKGLPADNKDIASILAQRPTLSAASDATNPFKSKSVVDEFSRISETLGVPDIKEKFMDLATALDFQKNILGSKSNPVSAAGRLGLLIKAGAVPLVTPSPLLKTLSAVLSSKTGKRGENK